MRGLNETIPIQDIFVSGLGAIERLEGNCLRFHLYVTQAADDGAPEKIVIAKIVAPACAVPDAILQMIAAIGDKAAQMIPMVGELMH